MKRTLNSFASVALVALTVAACQKEQLFDSSLEGEETVTFTVQSDQALTKATADGDGLGEGLNRCFVAVYMKVNEAQPYKLYDTPVATQDGADHKKFTFSVNLIRKQTYQIVVWADKGMYNVNPELTSVTRIADDIACNSDAYDAFYASVPFTQGTTASTAITAKRPFAQLNLITKDLRTGFEPKDIELTYTANTKFNPFDGTTSDPQEITYKAAAPHYTSLTVPGENTVAMNYLLAGDEQVILNEVKLKVTFTEDVDIAVANVPVRRNYRTNIKGNLFTEQTDFNITVVPIWGASDIEVVVPSTYNEAQAAVADPNIQTVVVSQEVVDDYLAKVSSGTITPDTANLPDGSSKKLIEFTLTSTSPVDLKQFELPAAPDGYAWHITHETGYPTQNVDVIAPAASSVIIDAPTSHVTLNGENYSAVTASTSGTTLVVPEGVTIAKLEVLTGGLEIHGTVTELVIAVGADVKVRDCEGLSQTVYDVAKNFLAPGYVGTQKSGKWNIALSTKWAERVVVKPAGYEEDATTKTVTISTPEALAWMAHRLNVDRFSYAGYTLTLTDDIDLSAAYWKPAGGNGGVRFQGTFDGGNHTISGMKIIETNAYGNAFFGDMSGSPTIKNVIFDRAQVQKGKVPQYSGNVYGIVAAYCYGKVLFDNVHVSNSKLFGFGKVGCILGMAADPGTHVTSIRNCSVTNTTVYYVYNASYFAGLIQNQADMQNLTITNCSRHCGISFVNLDTTAKNGDTTVAVKGEYWEYDYGDEGVYMYAAWGDYYTDLHYGNWSIPSLGDNYYIADGLCHNEI